MKIHFPAFHLFGAALVVAGALTVSPARADMLATYKPTEISNFVWQPNDYADEVSASEILLHGALTGSPNTTRVRFWGTEMSETDYVGFTLTAQPGFRLTVTDLTASTVVSAGSVTAFRWGYRVDEGSGFGEWTFGDTYSLGEPGFAFGGMGLDEKVWDFADFSTTGTVEFGLFGQSTAGGIDASIVISQPGNLSVNGAVDAVPEPSTYALIAIAGAMALVAARRRKVSAKF